MKKNTHEEFVQRFRGRSNQIGLKGIRELFGVPERSNPEVSSAEMETSPLKLPVRSSADQIVASNFPEPVASKSKLHRESLESIGRDRRSRSRQLLPEISPNKNYLPSVHSNDLNGAMRRYNSQPHRFRAEGTADSPKKKHMRLAGNTKVQDDLNRVRYPTAEHPDFLNSKRVMPKKRKYSQGWPEVDLNTAELHLNKRVEELLLRQIETINQVNRPIARLVRLIS